MEQETRRFAIEQAILLVRDDHRISNKTKAIFDIAEGLVRWIETGSLEQTK